MQNTKSYAHVPRTFFFQPHSPWLLGDVARSKHTEKIYATTHETNLTYKRIYLSTTNLTIEVISIFGEILISLLLMYDSYTLNINVSRVVSDLIWRLLHRIRNNYVNVCWITFVTNRSFFTPVTKLFTQFKDKRRNFSLSKRNVCYILCTVQWLDRK